MMATMRIGQELCGDSPIKNHIVWDEATTPLDLLAASVLLYIKRDESCSPPASSPRSSPIQKRKQYMDCDDFSDEGCQSPMLGDQESPKRFRRTTSEEDLSSASDEWSEPRKSVSRMTRSHSQEFDSDVEYEQQVAGEEEEDEYAFEDDDDEWSDGRLANLANLSSPISRVPRKKAPSGTACEKHKRWKKRCPDDCPMRKCSKSKKMKSPLAPLRSPRSPRELPSLKDEHLSLFQWSIDQMNTSPTPCSPVGSSSENERSYSSDSNMGSNDSEQEIGKSHPKMRIKLTKSSSTEDVFGMMMDDYESPKMSRSPTASRKNMNAKRNRGTRKYLPQACDRHKLLHAKCPANCPDRIKRDAELNLGAEVAAQ
jgi:hypothetical protein